MRAKHGRGAAGPKAGRAPAPLRPSVRQDLAIPRRSDLRPRRRARAVTRLGRMTAASAQLEHTFPSETATRSINEIRGIDRVTYDVTA